jgi:protein-tyrosine-phosphatase
VTEFDFVRFDHVLAMGRDHLEWLQRACPPLHHDKLRLFLEFSQSFDDGRGSRSLLRRHGRLRAGAGSGRGCGA